MESKSLYTRSYLTQCIVKTLAQNKDALRKEFSLQGRINSCFLDNLLPDKIAKAIYSAFPSPKEMMHLKSFRENKRIAAQMDLYNPLLEEVIYAFQDKQVVDLCEYITNIRYMEPDEELYAGGISLMNKGNFLNPHLDNSHDNEKKLFRVLNLLYYVTPDWKIENGGNLELWDNGVHGEPRTIVAQFNRLVLMITNKSSYHSVSKVLVNANRYCVSNYYFSAIPAEQGSYSHVTSFYGRPEESTTKTILLKADRKIRGLLSQMIGKKPFQTKHIYKKRGTE